MPMASFLTDGSTMTHSARSSRSLGISSGIFRISLRTVAESLMRSTSLISPAAKLKCAESSATRTNSSFFMTPPQQKTFYSGGIENCAHFSQKPGEVGHPLVHAWLRPGGQCRFRANADESLALEVQDDLLRRLFRGEIGGVDHHFSIGGNLVWIRNSRKLLDDASARLSVEPFAVAFFAGFDGSRDMHQDKTSVGFNHLPHVLAGHIVRSDRRADCDAAVLRNLRSNIADTANVDVAVLLGKTEFRG